MPALRILAATLLPTPLSRAQQDQPIIFAFDVRITLSDLAAERLRTTREAPPDRLAGPHSLPELGP